MPLARLARRSAVLAMLGRTCSWVRCFATPRIKARHEIIQQRTCRHGNHCPDHELPTWRSKVENAIVSLLPHGQAKLGEVAQRLGVSERTLTRLLASEQCTFSEILDALRDR